MQDEAAPAADFATNKALSDRLNKLHSAFFEAKQNLAARTTTFQKLLSGQTPQTSGSPHAVDSSQQLGYEAGVHYRPPVSAGGTAPIQSGRTPLVPAVTRSSVLATDIYGSAKQKAAAAAASFAPSAYESGLGSSAAPSAYTLSSPHAVSTAASLLAQYQGRASAHLAAAHDAYGGKTHAPATHQPQQSRQLDIVEILTASANQLQRSNEALGAHVSDLAQSRAQHDKASPHKAPRHSHGMLGLHSQFEPLTLKTTRN